MVLRCQWSLDAGGANRIVVHTTAIPNPAIHSAPKSQHARSLDGARWAQSRAIGARSERREMTDQRLRAVLARRWAKVRRRVDAGMATAEYAIATLAAAAFAGLLLIILRSDEVRGFLLGIIRQALSVG